MNDYKWATPQEWLRDYVSEIKDEQMLKSIIFSLMSKCYAYTIQDIFQDEMDRYGYFKII